jgi:hypothetical protein
VIYRTGRLLTTLSPCKRLFSVYWKVTTEIRLTYTCACEALKREDHTPVLWDAELHLTPKRPRITGVLDFVHRPESSNPQSLWVLHNIVRILWNLVETTVIFKTHKLLSWTQAGLRLEENASAYTQANGPRYRATRACWGSQSGRSINTCWFWRWTGGHVTHEASAIVVIPSTRRNGCTRQFLAHSVRQEHFRISGRVAGTAFVV